jgi:hypothetical protein
MGYLFQFINNKGIISHKAVLPITVVAVVTINPISNFFP